MSVLELAEIAGDAVVIAFMGAGVIALIIQYWKFR